MGPTENDSKLGVASQLVESVKEISAFPECNSICKKMYSNLVRRVKLLSPLFEELRDGDQNLGEEVIEGLELLTVSLDSAKKFLSSVNQSSKLYQALWLEKITAEFQFITEQIEMALSKIPFDKLNISYEVREQSELGTRPIQMGERKH